MMSLIIALVLDAVLHAVSPHPDLSNDIPTSRRERPPTVRIVDAGVRCRSCSSCDVIESDRGDSNSEDTPP